MKKWLFRIIILFVLLGIIVFYAGRFLDYSEKPTHADVIMVLAGDRGARMEKGVSLYKNGYAPKIIISGGIIYNNITVTQLMKQQAMSLGVPKSAIISEEQSESTYDNAVNTLKLMKKHHFKSALVVSSNYHMRRVKMIFDHLYKGTGIQLTYVAAKDPEYNPNKWWASNSSILTTITEYIKYVGYFVEYKLLGRH